MPPDPLARFMEKPPFGKDWQEFSDITRGVTFAESLQLVPDPTQVWQVVGRVPDVAVLACDEADARFRLVKVLEIHGLPALGADEQLMRIR